MLRKSLQIDFIKLHILHHASEEPLYGLWMIEELQRHGYRVGASDLYPKLHRLARSGLLREKDKVVGGKLRKYYRLTPRGRRYLKEQKRRLIELVSEAFSLAELRNLLRGRTERRRRRRH
jgi:DNA-binding PadR family transcriptional regulator